MRTRVRLLGQPVHPALVHFPLALLLAAVVWDAVALATGDAFWGRAAWWTLIAGLATALPAAVTGLLDFLGLPRDHRAVPVALAHLGVNVSAVTCFALSFLLRLGDGASDRYGVAVALGFAGAILLLAGGTLGGVLVFRHGLGRADAERAGDTPVLRARPPGRREPTRSAS
jgi:uncharacterized membrane protein